MKKRYYENPDTQELVIVSESPDGDKTIEELSLITELEWEDVEEDDEPAPEKKPRKKREPRVDVPTVPTETSEEPKKDGLELFVDPKKDQVANVLNMLRSGIDVEEIEEKTGMSRGMIYYHKRKNGIGGQQKKKISSIDDLTDAKKEKIHDLYDLGHPIGEIAEKLGIDEDIVVAVVNE